MVIADLKEHYHYGGRGGVIFPETAQCSFLSLTELFSSSVLSASPFFHGREWLLFFHQNVSSYNESLLSEQFQNPFFGVWRQVYYQIFESFGSQQGDFQVPDTKKIILLYWFGLFIFKAKQYCFFDVFHGFGQCISVRMAAF